ncbi:S1C family serine protease [Anaerosporobacter sp.]|uniref:S1C family serine protease n=1 Tax=Anaerosporobacter sp. TaxID=1872529 RepID=UPI00286FAA72|nr:trypsin-like peptidase domain-containing protein [Anaerosporobacter sp.]
MYNEMNNNQENNQTYENVYGDNNSTIDSVIVEETIKESKGRRHIPNFVRVPASAIAFGVIASLSFQAVQGTAPSTTATVQESSTNISVDNSTDTTSDSGIKAVTTDTSSSSTTAATDVSQIVENVMPSIVAIDCTSTVQQQDVFGRVYSQESTGSGSGIIIGQNDNEVLIVTNNHVVSGATAVEITFSDESKATAEVKGTDSGADLAVISVPLSSLTEDTKNTIRVATLGDSDSVKVGQMAIAIGNALGYGQSTTVGYISAKDREVATEDYTMKLLQTDAAINPGNSGGALLDSQGRVIGINSVKYASEEVEGIGYAIPISYAIPIINDLISKEDISEEEQAYLGITGQDVTDTISERYGMPIGVYVGQVSENSPASEGGLQSGDVITSFNDREVKTMSQLQELLGNRKAGEVIEIVVSRLVNGNYEEQTITVTLGKKSEATSSQTTQESTTEETQGQTEQNNQYGNGQYGQNSQDGQMQLPGNGR